MKNIDKKSIDRVVSIYQKYYDPDSELYQILRKHSEQVAKHAIRIAEKRPEDIDINFVYEAAMLHDIGIFLTNAQGIGCNGKFRYICHGYLGRELLEKEGLPKHGLVSERHTYITREDREKDNLPIPDRDMIPQTIEEEIICYVDKFFSKAPDSLGQIRDFDETKKFLMRFGEDKGVMLEKMREKFGVIA